MPGRGRPGDGGRRVGGGKVVAAARGAATEGRRGRINAGRVTALRYFHGEFLDARHADCGVRNEQFWIDLADTRSGSLVRVKQIAGAIARRIVCWLKPDEEVRAGERLGMIKFGSRTEVSLPVDRVQEALVKVGDTVLYGKYSGSDVEVNGKEFKILRESDLLAKLSK